MTGSRILLPLPVALVLVLCLAPMGMGFLIEQTYGSVIESVRENPQNAFSISGEFDQGLWSSSSVTRIEWPTGESVELDQDWIHGPVPLGELFRGRSPLDWVFAVVEATLDSQSESWPQVAAHNTKPNTATGVHRLSLKPSSVLSSARRARCASSRRKEPAAAGATSCSSKESL